MMSKKQSVLIYCGFFLHRNSQEYDDFFILFRNSQEYYVNCTLIVKNKKSGVTIAVNVRKFCDISWTLLAVASG